MKKPRVPDNPEHLTPENDPYFEQFLNISLIRAGRKLQLSFYKDAIAPVGLSIQEWRALLFVERLQDAHMRQIARYGRLDATHTGRAVAKLVAKGLVSRFDDPDDTRRKRIRPTQAGSDMVAQIWPKARALDEKVRERLGKTRYGVLREALDMILDMEELEPDFQNDLQ